MAPGAGVLAGTRTAWSWTRVEVVEDGWLHLRLLTEKIRGRGSGSRPRWWDVDRLTALDAFVAEYEAEHGQIIGEEMEAVVRRAREPREPR